ncbi:creatininase family protein [Bacteroidota bacterium]
MKTRNLWQPGCLLIILMLNLAGLYAQDEGGNTLPIKYEELTAPEFREAILQSGGTCIIPIGILEKHGTHLPLGTDVIIAREIALRGAGKEYAVVFPEYFVSQVSVVRPQPGTISYSHETTWNLLDETCSELARNGMKKIILVNGHGGNNYLLPYFCQVQLDKPRDYCVVIFTPDEDPEVMEKVKELRNYHFDHHAGDLETGMMQVVRPDLVDEDHLGEESGVDQERLKAIPHASTGLDWYASFPNHYAGDAREPSKEAAEILIQHRADLLSDLIRVLKTNDDILDLQNQFYREAEDPLSTGH